MRIIILIGAVILGVALQSTLLPALHLPGQIIPDIIMIMVISYGLLKGPDAGMFFGFAAGLFMDLVSGGLIGIQALSKMAVGFVAGFMEKNIFKDNLLVPSIVVFFGTIVGESFNCIMYMAFNANHSFFTNFFWVVIPMAFYNAILAPFVYYLFLKMERFMHERAK